MFLELRKLSARGVTRAAQRLLTHKRYQETLLTANELRTLNTRIVSENHVLKTVTVNKLSLSAFDNKRFIMGDGITTLPYGHYLLAEEITSSNSPADSWKHLFERDLGDDEISWDNGHSAHEELILESDPEWDFPAQPPPASDPERDFHAQPPPAKRQRQHMSRGLNQLLDSVEFHEVDPGLIHAQNTTESDISDSEIANLEQEDTASDHDYSQNHCPFINFEAEEED